VDSRKWKQVLPPHPHIALLDLFVVVLAAGRAGEPWLRNCFVLLRMSKLYFRLAFRGQELLETIQEMFVVEKRMEYVAVKLGLITGVLHKLMKFLLGHYEKRDWDLVGRELVTPLLPKS
jgi:hypothetical protein